ncbi:MAG: 1-acyl-sn-glycerol-3-phosphate acyltransferase [Candidatus Rokubacteria bacterium]|nr:1-acyl-sn-glycerol-3-phosphate acyltransferase [Candidatus Rokubacteria bacterium]
MLYTILRLLIAVFLRLLFRLEVRGAEHVPAVGLAMIVANHSSLLDPLAVGVTAPRPLHYMAKAELFRIPLFGRLLHAVNARPVRRDGSDSRALREALRILESGQALLVFPEGTRAPEGMLREGRAGAGMLALLSGAPVVPAYVEGTGRALPRGRWLPRPGKIRVVFGPSLSFGKMDDGRRRERYLSASGEMMAAIARLKQAVEVGERAGMTTARAGGSRDMRSALRET